MYYAAPTEDKLFPKYQTAVVGQNVYFSCIAKRIIRWELNGKPLPSNVASGIVHGTRQHLLHISNVHLGNAGTYSCYGEDNGSVFEGKGELSVRGK